MRRGSLDALIVAAEVRSGMVPSPCRQPRRLSVPLVPPLGRFPFYHAARVCLHVVSLLPHLGGFPLLRRPRYPPTPLQFPPYIQTPLPQQTHSLVRIHSHLASRVFPASFPIWLSPSPRLSPALPRARPCLAHVRGLLWPLLPPCFAGDYLRQTRLLFPGAPSAGSFLPSFFGLRLAPPTARLPRGPPDPPALLPFAPPPTALVRLAVAAMTGKRQRRERAARPSDVPNPPEDPGELAPVLLRAAAALVSREGAGTPSRAREPVYRSPRGCTHPHLRARGGSFRRRHPPRPPPVLHRQIVGPHLQAPSFQPPPPPPPLVPSQQSSHQHSSQQQSSVPTASSPLVDPPASASGSLSAPPAVPPPPVLSPASLSLAEALLVPPRPAPQVDGAPPPPEPPQRQHPLVPADPALPARFPPPRAQSPPLLPDAPDPEDDEKWWNGELWESPPQPGTTWGRDWDVRNNFVVDILRWERRMLGVGECLSHVATVLEQLHEGLQGRNYVLRDPQLNEQQQGVVRAAAAQGLWRLLRMPLEPEHPDEDEGPGARAFRRVATAAEESPLQLVPALASLLRWIRRRFYVLNRV
ncbi:unnamed protein product [Closterium sp. Naga37s-1]|nr:unnamed protein product [Closterium sp. Naga37s-1]